MAWAQRSAQTLSLLRPRLGCRAAQARAHLHLPQRLPSACPAWLRRRLRSREQMVARVTLALAREARAERCWLTILSPRLHRLAEALAPPVPVWVGMAWAAGQR